MNALILIIFAIVTIGGLRAILGSFLINERDARADSLDRSARAVIGTEQRRMAECAARLAAYDAQSIDYRAKGLAIIGAHYAALAKDEAAKLDFLSARLARFVGIA